MNKSKLKSYAPQARKDFIAMVQSRAAQLGISDTQGQLQIEPCEVQGQVAIIAGQAFPAKIANQRNALITRMQKDGFAATTEAIAYTWFNRFAALRYMELHNYLGHGQRVLSSVAEGGLPDILTHALELVESGDLPGISMAEVSELKLASKDGELYKRLLVAQCNQLAGNMGFLFERIDDDSELLLPDNLLRTDSVIRKLVDGIEEDDWQQVEIIGWLYQFYISEKKDQVIGKVVKSEDIPAATQLFTPNWIVKYLVQNSVGRLWLQANPGSTLASQMAYYIAPAEQTPEVNAQLDALIRARISEDGDTLNPESISVLDPACGSGHILVEAYDLLKAIYLERGYRERDIPRLILENNLYGLDIDDRAAQLAAFALLMKARADDRRLFSEPVRLNVLSLQESTGLDAAQLVQDLGLNDAAERNALNTLLSIFTQAKTFGSLLQIPNAVAQALPQLAARITAAQTSGDLYAQSAAAMLQPILQQAQVLARQYDAVVANPPYMGAKYFCPELLKFANYFYKAASADIFACFVLACLNLAKEGAVVSNINIPSWMTNSTFSNFRRELFDRGAIISLVHNGRGVFGSDFGSCAFSVLKSKLPCFQGVYRKLFDNPATVVSNEELSVIFHDADNYIAAPADFYSVDGAPISYQVGKKIRSLYSEAPKISKISTACQGLSTSDDVRFVRSWYEVSTNKSAWFGSKRDEISTAKWFPYNKGGSYRKWYGNIEFVINWESDGAAIKLKKPKSVIRNEKWYFSESISWQDYTIGALSFRHYSGGFIFATNAHSAFFESDVNVFGVLAYCNSSVFSALSSAVSPGVHFNSGYFSLVPCEPSLLTENVSKAAKEAVFLAKMDWDSNELSWDFLRLDFLSVPSNNLEAGFLKWKDKCQKAISKLIQLEESINIHFSTEYGLVDEVLNTVLDEQISLTRANREKDMQRLVSYAIGCMMGRYSLDEPGLVYAQAGNVGFDPQRYTRFAADADGIVPVSDISWFSDDATHRVKEFLVAVWGQDTLAENLGWLADSLGRKADETAEDALRRYISGSFFKDHCQTYKKRPIYWLFSSGKQKAFEALVYLHRYNDSTLARMRAEYVVPLTGRMAERIRLLEDDSIKAASGAAKKAIDKQIEKLKKKLEELRLYDEKLRHFADQRVTIDLDDGVKVNYGKFGDLLDNVKGITGGVGDD